MEDQDQRMTAFRGVIGLVWLLALLAGRGMWHSASASAVTATSAGFTDQASWPPYTVTSEPLMEPHDPETSGSPRFDLFGNEIEEAIADYRVDLRGGIYERHSPETAVQKLGAPTS
jgi:hypothetical protein